MRGLGIGMIVTALLMGVATREKIPLSDAEIRAKALELGMVESDSLKLTDLQNIQPSSTLESEQPSDEGMTSGSQEESQEEEESASDKNSREEGISASGEQSPGEGDSASGNGSEPVGEENGSPGPENQEEQLPDAGEAPGEAGEEKPAEGEVVAFVIESGMDSYSVCRMLAEAGLVKDADTFDTYINELGYSRSVRAGSYEIPMGTDEEEIARIITGNR